MVTGKAVAGRLAVGDQEEVVVDGAAALTVVLGLEHQRKAVPDVGEGQEVAVRVRDVEDAFPSGCGCVERPSRGSGDKENENG